MKKKLLMLTTFIILISLCISGVLTPPVAALNVAEPSLMPYDTSKNNSQERQLFLMFLNQVAGINMNHYNISSFKETSSQVIGSNKQQTCISATLTNNQSSLGIAMILIEGKVRFYDLSIISGRLDGLQLNFPESMKITKTAISNYKAYFNANYCTEFDAIVPTIAQGRNLTNTNAKAQVDVYYYEDSSTDLRYTSTYWYENNGPKIRAQSVQATMSKTGIITFFADNLGLYKMASTGPSITKEQAIDAAMPYFNSYIGQSNKEIETLTPALTFVTDLNGTRGDSFMIYPQWEISAKLSNLNDGVYGYDVLLWADNGQVSHFGELATDTIPSTAFGTRNNYSSYEQSLISDVCGQIASYSQTIGFNAYNYYGSGANGANFVTAAYDYGQDYSVVFYKGHGAIDPVNGPFIQEDDGTSITAQEIYDNSYWRSYDHHKLAFIWSCEQGNTIAGMPNAWLHTTSLSSDGYLTPDWNCQTFIGFNDAGPQFHVTIDGQSDAGYWFVRSFFNLALTQGFNINSALDATTEMLWNQEYCNSMFYQGIYDENNVYYGNMVVYGDGSLYIAAAPTHLTISVNPTEGYTSVTDQFYSYGTNAQVMAWEISGNYFDHWIVDNSYIEYSNPITISMTTDHTLQPVYTTNPSYYWLTVYTWDYFPDCPISADIYVDGNFIGNSYATILLPQGVHQVIVEDSVWSDPWGQCVPFFNFDDWTSNGMYRTIHSDTNLCAWYL